jgi:hypothetical protein
MLRRAALACAAALIASLGLPAGQAQEAPAPPAPALSDGRAVWTARCAACHGDRVPTQPAPLPRHAPLHAALAPPPAEQDALAAFLAAARRFDASDLSDLRGPADEKTARPALPPRWALAPWKWKNEHTGPDDVRADVAALRSHDVPTGVYLIDSPWSSGYGTHEFWAERWREGDEAVAGQRLVDGLRAQGLAVVLWTTAMVNDGSKSKPAWDTDAERALWGRLDAAGLFFQDEAWDLLLGAGVEGSRIRWWKGVGSHLDVSRPEGRRAWYELLDRALALGIDGFKVDGGWPPLTAAYYHHTAAHVARRTAGRGVTISRPRGGNRSSAAACWTGDEEPTWAGLRHALTRLRLAAKDGYSTTGSDIGGFGGGPTPELLVRWAQAMLLAGVFELGGGGVHEPWELGDRCLQAYRRLAERRSELVPYLHSAAHAAHVTGRPWLRFTDDAKAPAWLCGDDLFAAPLTDDVREQSVSLPPGRWIRLRLGDADGAHDEAGELHEGRVTVRIDGLEDAPLFVREGAILPLEVTSDRLGHGGAASADAVTFDCWPSTAPAETPDTCDFRWGDAADPEPTRVEQQTDRSGALRLGLGGRRLVQPRVVFRIHRRAHAGAHLIYGQRTPWQAEPYVEAERCPDEATFRAAVGPAVWVDAASNVTWLRAPAASAEGEPLTRARLR